MIRQQHCYRLLWVFHAFNRYAAHVDGLAASAEVHLSRRKAFTENFVPLSVLAIFAPSSPCYANGSGVTTVWKWDDKAVGGFPVLVNGRTSQSDGSSVQLRYTESKANKDIPHRIVVYQRTGTADENRLQNAVAQFKGVPRALDIGDRIGTGESSLANLKLAATVASNSYQALDQQQHTYYTFDMVYNNELFYLVSATVQRQRLYVMVVECQQGNALHFEDLRSSFRVEPLE